MPQQSFDDVPRPHTSALSRRAVLSGGAGLLGLWAVSACGGKSGAGSAPTSQPSVGGTVTGAVEFVYPGTSDAERAFAEQFVSAEKAKYPGLDVSVNYLSWNEMQKTLAVRVQAGNPPDLTATQDITALVGMKALADLTPYLSSGSISSGDFLPGTYDYSSMAGALYSVPYLATAFTLLVNEKLLQQAGFEVDDLKDWSTMEQAAAAMTKGNVSGFAYPLGNPRFVFRGALTAAYSLGLQMNDVSDAAREKWTALLEHLKKLKESSPAAQTTWDYPDMWRAFAGGQLGMVAGGTYYSANVYSINPQIIGDTRQISYPAATAGGKLATPVSSVGYGLFAGAKNPSAAWAMISDLTSPENVLQQAAAVNLPARTSVDKTALFAAAAKIYPDAAEGHQRVTEDAFALVAANGTPLTKIQGQPDMEPALQDIMVRYLDGKVETAAAVDEIVAAFGKINKDYGN